MMFSSHIDMICKNSAFLDIFVKLLFIEYRLSKDTPYMRKWWVSTFQQIVEFITNFGSITKGAKPLNFSKALYGQHAFLMWKLFIKFAVSVFKVFFHLYSNILEIRVSQKLPKLGGGGGVGGESENKGTWDLIKEGFWNRIPGSVLVPIALYALKHDMAV